MNACQCDRIRTQALRAWMELQGLTYRDLAREMKCSEAFISRVLSGNKKLPAPRRDELIKIGLPEHLLPVTGGCQGQNQPPATSN